MQTLVALASTFGYADDQPQWVTAADNHFYVQKLVNDVPRIPSTPAYRKLIEGELDKGTIGEIRSAANTGLVLGNEPFRSEVEQLTGQRQHHMNRGPKPKTRRRA